MNILETLEREICFHYAGQKGAAIYSLQRDACVSEAKRILGDLVAFKKVLNVTSP